jgi:hypothetical protein
MPPEMAQMAGRCRLFNTIHAFSNGNRAKGRGWWRGPCGLVNNTPVRLRDVNRHNAA